MKKIKQYLLESFDKVLGIREPIISNEEFSDLCINHLDKKEVLEETAIALNIKLNSDFMSEQNLSKFHNFSDMLSSLEKLKY